ncbi:uncharacterized protein LOC113759892 [Coffea eugenioides]|uniref:uncharacterized protein LOC113759892 n=1 Tax=Coffea eugenioides TaxID=49369 RepID=UPI000F60935F|nr:uncharacterized protein LOC113759892 [Coffea eugenioides]
MAESANPDLSGMTKTMKDKYDKYWGRVEKMNMLIFIAYMLDPRTKFEYFEFIACKMYGDTEGAVVARVAKDAMYELFDKYKRFNTDAGSTTISQSSTSSLSSGSENSISSFDGEASDKELNVEEKLEELEEFESGLIKGGAGAIIVDV